jgi:hypothetical protein
MDGGSLDAHVGYLPIESVGSNVVANRSTAGLADRKARPGLLRDQAGGLALGHLFSIYQKSQAAILMEACLHQEMAIA